jgi:outer membrane protein
MGVRSLHGVAAAVLLMAFAGPAPALADTIEAALVRAYQNNPQLNAQRAQVRSIDENVPQALAGYRPQAALTASAGYQYTDTNSVAPGFGGEIHGTDPPRSAGLTVTQTHPNEE